MAAVDDLYAAVQVWRQARDNLQNINASLQAAQSKVTDLQSAKTQAQADLASAIAAVKQLLGAL